MAANKIKIAFAEDHEMVRKGIIEIISSFGEFEVVIDANDGEELLEKLRHELPLPEIAIIDINMPRRNGYETLNALRKKYPHIKVLVMTMHGHELAIIKMLRDGACGYILKNSHPTELKAALQSIHNTGIYLTGVATQHLIQTIQLFDSLPSLTETEINVLQMCCTDMTYKEISDKMKMAETAITGHRDNLFGKLRVNSRPALVLCAVKMGLISITA